MWIDRTGRVIAYFDHVDVVCVRHGIDSDNNVRAAVSCDGWKIRTGGVRREPPQIEVDLACQLGAHVLVGEGKEDAVPSDMLEYVKRRNYGLTSRERVMLRQHEWTRHFPAVG